MYLSLGPWGPPTAVHCRLQGIMWCSRGHGWCPAMVSHGRCLDQWPLTGVSRIKTSSSWPLYPAVTKFPPPRCHPAPGWLMSAWWYDVSVGGVSVGPRNVPHITAMCTATSSRRQSVPIWIRSRPGISFCNVFAMQDARNTTILAIYDSGLRYHYPGQVNKIELGNRGCRKCAQPKQSWPDLTPVKVGGE